MVHLGDPLLFLLGVLAILLSYGKEARTEGKEFAYVFSAMEETKWKGEVIRHREGIKGKGDVQGNTEETCLRRRESSVLDTRGTANVLSARVMQVVVEKAMQIKMV